MSHNTLQICGARFGRLVAIGRNGSTAGGKSLWLCQCDCGRETVVRGEYLKSGKTTSCGCKKADAASQLNVSHGMSKTRTYKIWQGMFRRCESRSHPLWYRYGGRGISVCKQWNSFERFLADMGECPNGLEIDRIDNNKGYSPSNCHWATRKQNARNRCTSKFIEFRGERKTLAEWAELFTVGQHVMQRIAGTDSPEAEMDMLAKRGRKNA